MACETSEPRAASTKATRAADDTPVATLGDVLLTTSARMSKQGRRDTEPELLLRRALHRMGLRYRVDAPLPGMARRRADVLFNRAEVAVFVDGCFWHSCPEHRTAPTNNASWWAAKLTRNVERDRETDAHLASLGWAAVRVWEHEDMADAAAAVGRIVRSRLISPGPARRTRQSHPDEALASQAFRSEGVQPFPPAG